MIANDRKKKEKKNVDLPKSARLDYFGRGGTRFFRYGIYPGSADPMGKKLANVDSPAINRKVSMPARRKEMRLRNFGMDVHLAGATDDSR